MMARYGSADTQERQIAVGRSAPRSTTTPPPAAPYRTKTAEMDLYEGEAPWKRIAAGDPDFVAASSEWDALTTKPQGIDRWTWIFHNAMAGKRAQNAGAPMLSGLGSSGSGSGGIDANTMSALRSLVGGVAGGGASPDIASAYGDLMSGAQQRSAAQQAMIDQFYGGAQASAQARLNDTLARLQTLIGGARGELDTQTAEGRQRIDETTQRVMDAIAAQSNPYAGVQAQAAPVAEAPLLANLQALGQNTAGLSALQNMFASDAAQNRNATQDMINMLSASNRAAQQSRAVDVQAARGGAQQDLAAAQRAAAQLLTNQQLQGEAAARDVFNNQISSLDQAALQARLAGSTQLGDVLNQLGLGQLQTTLQERTAAQGRRDALAEQLLALAAKGVDVSGLISQLMGAR